jgi:hypothetical protein
MYESLSIITLCEQAYCHAAGQSDTGRAGAGRLGEGALVDHALLRVLMGGTVPPAGVDDLASNFVIPLSRLSFSTSST